MKEHTGNLIGPFHRSHGSPQDVLKASRNSRCTSEYERSTHEIMVSEGKPQIESLRDVVGDFGIALFAPLLDFDNDVDGRCKNVTLFTSNNTQDTVSSATAQAESESDQYHSEYDDYDIDDTNVYENDEDEGVVEDKNYSDELAQSLDTVQIVPESLSQIEACPPILSEQNIQYLQCYLPFSIRDYIWERRFVIGLHGDSFCTLLQKCDGYKNSIVVIRTTSGHILGGYASEEWRANSAVGTTFMSRSGSSYNPNKYRSARHSYYGTGQSFIFGSFIVNESGGDDVNNNNTTTLRVYSWTGHNDYCQICDVDRSIVCMGGVGEFGWIVSDHFTIGRTGPCATYNNPPLIEDTTFRIADFEIYTLISPIAQFLHEHLKP
jgi:hypothetical protein